MKNLFKRPWVKRSLIGLFGATVLLGGVTACGHRAHHGPGWQTMSAEDATAFKAKAVERVGSKLELDAAQKDKLGVLVDKLQAQRQALVAGTPDPRAQVQALVAGTTFDRAAAQALVTAKTDAVRSVSPEVINAAADFYDSLKPAQQQQVRDFMARGRGWRQG